MALGTWIGYQKILTSAKEVCCPLSGMLINLGKDTVAAPAAEHAPIGQGHTNCQHSSQELNSGWSLGGPRAQVGVCSSLG